MRELFCCAALICALPAWSQSVQTGYMPCELGKAVTVTPDVEHAGEFLVQIKKVIFHMHTVATSTGAVRLEDSQDGAVWIQLPNKSMLLNAKLGQRMADACQSPEQMAVSESMKLAPPKSLLEGPELAKK